MAAAGRGVVGLLLAGGRGTRFDASGHQDKLLASLDGRALASHAATTLCACCESTYAVLPPDKPALAQVLREAGCTLIPAEDTRLGLGHSIAAAVSRILELEAPRAIVVMLADMPRVRADTVRAVLAALGSDPTAIAAAAYQGRRGHPVAFARAHFAALRSLRGDRGAAALLATQAITQVEVDDPGIFLDVDTLADLADVGHDASMDRRRDTPEHHRCAP